MYLAIEYQPSTTMRNLASALFCLLFIACSSSKNLSSSENSSHDLIVFGEGGGFAGTVTTYKLYKDGKLFRKKPREGAYSQLESIDQTQAEQYFSTVEAMGFKNMACDEPENWYYFLELGSDVEKTKLVWGSNSRSATETLKLFCKNLLGVAKKQAITENKPVNQ